MFLVTGFDTESELIQAYDEAKVETDDYTSADFETTSPVLAGIIFENEFINDTFPKNIKVKHVHCTLI